MAKLELACLASSLDGRMPRKRDNARPTIFPITSGRSELKTITLFPFPIFSCGRPKTFPAFIEGIVNAGMAALTNQNKVMFGFVSESLIGSVM
jgi:hypothetical protein